MKAHLFATLFLGITGGAARHTEVGPELFERLDPNVSLCVTYIETYLVPASPTRGPGGFGGRPGQGGGGIQPTTTPLAAPGIILQAVPLATTPKRKTKRDLGGFVSDSAVEPNPKNCAGATVFQLNAFGELTEGGEAVYFTPGLSYRELKGVGAAPDGAVTRGFVNQGGFLSWANNAFPRGLASFCQVFASGQVFAVFEDRTEWPEACVLIELQIFSCE